MRVVMCQRCQIEFGLEKKSPVCPRCGAIYSYAGKEKNYGFEWRTRAEFLGLPLAHIAFGRHSNGKLRVAKGIIAIGQFGIGLISIAQFGVGLLFGLGQFSAGSIIVAQFAFGLVLGVGQIATGYIAIGQLVLAHYGLCQAGIARSLAEKFPQAVDFFRQFLNRITQS